MLDTKLMIFVPIVLVALIVASIVPSTKEGFWNIPSRTWKVERIMADNQEAAARGDFYSVPNFQSILSPRFSNVNYGPNLRTQMPPIDVQGSPLDPLSAELRPMKKVSFADPNYTFATGYDTGEKYNFDSERAKYFSANPNASGYSSGRCGAAGAPVENYAKLHKLTPQGSVLPAFQNDHDASVSVSGYANGNFNQVQNQAYMNSGAPIPTDTVAVNETQFLDANGEMKQPIVYDRYIFANRNSRNRRHGDPIRGDLPVVPCQNNQWFHPSAANTPSLVLQQGAMNVMGGIGNETAGQLANLIYNASGRAETAIGGVDMAQVNISNDIRGALAAAQGDVFVTSFP
jgi:hypothetical protein